jgi:OOP family OmpA-OmpF porin
MKKHLLCTLLAGMILAPVAAMAAESFYVGANVGRAETKSEFAMTTKETDTGYKLYGGYQFTPSLALEGGYVKLADGVIPRSGVILNAEPEAYYIAGQLSLPLNEQFKLFGKIGAARVRTERSLGFGSSTEVTRLIGLGVSSKISPQMEAVLEYEDYGKIHKERGGLSGLDGNLKARLLSAGIRYAF